jgi:hypothetical protein
MKTSILTIFSLFLSSFLSSQITVTDLNIASIGDTLYEAHDTMPGTSIGPGSAGANQVWDFSTLQAHFVDTTIVIDPSTTPYGSMHPTADICIMDEDGHMYIDKSTSGITLVGQEKVPMSFLFLPLPLTYGLTQAATPSMMEDSVFFNDSQKTPGHPLSDVAVTTASMGTITSIDSIGFSSSFGLAFNCDAYGQLTLPNGGTYDALRLIIDNIMTTKGSVHYNNAWHVMPDFVASLMGGSATDTFIETNYQWWTNNPNVKFMLAELTPESLTQTGEVSYHNGPAPSSSDIIELNDNDISVFPNPSSYQLNIKMNTIMQDAELKLTALDGRIVIHEIISGSTNLDLLDLSKGTYILNISTEKGQLHKKVVVE